MSQRPQINETSPCQHNIEHTTPILSDFDNNNNSMSITAIFDHVPAMTSLDRWTEETYGNTPIISNRTIVDMASHVVWLVSRGCPRCYSFTTTTRSNIFYFEVNGIKKKFIYLFKNRYSFSIF